MHFNAFFENYAPKGALPLMENLEKREDYGVSKAEQFTWKQLLDGYACCGYPCCMPPSLMNKENYAKLPVYFS